MEKTKKERLAEEFKKIEKREKLKKKAFTEKYLAKEDKTTFKRKFLLFLSGKKRCFNCKSFDPNVDRESMLIICPILEKPICHTCKNSEQFALISATSAAKKFGVDKKDIDMLNLPYIEVPNPYYTAQKMKLRYEFMIKEGLP